MVLFSIGTARKAWHDSSTHRVGLDLHVYSAMKEVQAIRRIFSLVDMITNTKFSNCPNLLKNCVVKQ